ncbi:hypothetical protein FACS1894132_10570 [Clostridia bacterium]|nr:hypothetical protein FACS1894132_10570 [Clostridia bacterium]
MANNKKTEEDPKKKKKKGKGENEANTEGEVAVVQPKFVKKRKKQEVDWLIFPIIIVIVLIVLFVIKISIELIHFSKEVSKNPIPVTDGSTSIIVVANDADSITGDVFATDSIRLHI